jgi:hypothetical protein
VSIPALWFDCPDNLILIDGLDTITNDGLQRQWTKPGDGGQEFYSYDLAKASVLKTLQKMFSEALTR